MIMAETCHWLIREFQPGDKNKILSDWAFTNRHDSDWRWAPKEAYVGHQRAVQAILPITDILVATDPKMPSLIYGWCCAEPDIKLLHMVYVRHDFRRNGIGSLLMRRMFDGIEPPFRYTHKTKCMRKFGLRAKWDLTKYERDIL